MAPELAAMVVEQIASALGHAHQAGSSTATQAGERHGARGWSSLMDFGIALS